MVKKRGGGRTVVDVRRFFTPNEVRAAEAELARDKAFQRELRAQGASLDDLYRTAYPLKYLGIELHGGSGPASSRFPLATVLRIALRPRSQDGVTSGLRLSAHRKAFIARFPDVDAILSEERLKALGRAAFPLSANAFAASAYAAAAAPALLRLEEETGVPPRVAEAVLRKGLAAYRRGHRPGMSAHGWARARLSSFVMKGCTHYFPDHTLAEACPPRTHAFWSGLPCLCRKSGGCVPGKRS